jgi:hypothetical protein
VTLEKPNSKPESTIYNTLICKDFSRGRELLKMLQYLKGKSSYRLQREFRELQKRYWGQHLWGRGYFCVTVGAVTEEQVKRYIEEQEDGSGAFQVWDEPPTPTE